MSEWPDAPRLGEALRHRAGQIDVTSDGQSVAERSLTDSEVALLHLSIGDTVEQSPGRRVAAFAVASLALTALCVAAVLLVQRERSGDVAAERPDAGEESSVSSGLPALAPGHCEALDGSPERFSAGGSEIVVGGTVGFVGDVKSMVVLVPGDLPGGAEAVIDGLAGPDIVVYVVEAEDDVRQAMSAIMPIACGPSRRLADFGTGLASDIACLDYGGSGFSGFLFVGAVDLPHSCVTRQATVVIDTAPLVDEQMWVDAYGCSAGSLVRFDEERNVERYYYDCPLFHIETVDDPLTATFNGKSLPELVQGMLPD